MTIYSYAQLEQFWINAGGEPSMAPLMAAIAEAESAGNPDAVNPSGATGLWQILGAVNPADQPNLTDPVVNAREAVLKYQSQGLDAWQTYSNGAYEPFLSNSTPPDSKGVPAAASLDAAQGSNSGACLIGPWFGVCVMDKSEARALIGGLCLVAGGLLVLPGLIILVASGFAGSGAGGALSAAAQPLARVPVYGRAVRRLTLQLGGAGADERAAGLPPRYHADVVGGQLIDGGGELMPVAAHRLGDVLDHVTVAGRPDDREPGLPGGVLGHPGGGLE